MLDVRNARHAIGQRSQVWRAPGRFQFALAVQFVGQCHQVDGLLVFAEDHHVREDAAVLVEEKILGSQGFDGGIQRVIVQDDSAEHGAFRFEIVRQRLFKGGLAGHFSFAYYSPYIRLF